MVRLFISPDLPAALAVSVGIRAAVVLGAAWAVTRLLRRSAAATRHAVWSVALLTLLVLPAAGMLLPRWDAGAFGRAARSLIPVAHVELAQSAVAPGSVLPAPARAPSAAMAVPEHYAAPRPELARHRTGTPEVLLLVLWAAGSALALVRLLLGVASARRLVSGSTPAGAGPADLVARLAAHLGIRRPVRLHEHAALTVPVSCGVLHPAIVLPAGARAWDAERLRVVLLHELAHVRRFDWAWLLVAQTTRALYWLNPLAWLAAREAGLEAERACDDEVLRAGTRSLDYAEHLYAIAAALTGARALRGALAMAQPATLGTRVRAILASRTDRSPLRARALAAAAFLAVAVGLPLATMRLLGEGRDAAREQAALLALDSTDATARAEAAWALGTRGSARALEPLAARLHDRDATVRGMAAWALGRLGRHDAAPALIAALEDRESDVREMAVLALGKLGDRHVVADLEPMVHDPVAGVRSVLTTALEDLGGDDAARLLADLVLRDADAHTRNMAVWSLRTTAGAGAASTLRLALHDEDAGVRRAAAANLGNLRDRASLDALAEVTADHDASVRSNAASALGDLRDERAAEVIAAVAAGDPDWHVRLSAVDALGRTPGTRATDALIAATRDPIHQVRLTAVEVLNHRAG